MASVNSDLRPLRPVTRLPPRTMKFVEYQKHQLRFLWYQWIGSGDLSNTSRETGKVSRCVHHVEGVFYLRASHFCRAIAPTLLNHSYIDEDML